MNKAKRRICTITFSILFMLCVYLCMPKIEETIPEIKIEAVQLKTMQVTTPMAYKPMLTISFTNEAADLRAEINRAIPDLYTLEEREIIARVVHAEARGECFEGQIAVAQVVLNRLESGKFGETLNKITRRSQFAKSSTYNDENMRAVNQAIWDRPLPDDTYYFCRGKEFYGEFYIKIGHHCFFRD